MFAHILIIHLPLACMWVKIHRHCFSFYNLTNMVKTEFIVKAFCKDLKTFPSMDYFTCLQVASV